MDRFDPTTERFAVFKPDVQGGTVSYFEIAEDRHGAMWLGTELTGLQRFDPLTGHFTVYEYDPNDPRSLSDNRINSVFLDHFGALWVGTQNGLDKLDPETGTFTDFYERAGLPGQQIVLYARGETAWWVQPFAEEPFTRIQTNSTWSNSTHPGMEYAALLVDPGFRPPPTTGALPTEGVVTPLANHHG